MRNTPISEGAVCGVAIGAAQAGLRPVVEIMFIDFITLALDQLVNQAAKAHFMSGGQLSVPLVLRTQGGAGGRGGAQHSQSLEAWLTHVPGLKVVMPSSAADAAGLLRERDRRPEPGRVRREQVAVLPPRARADVAPSRSRSAERTCSAPGDDITIVALSRMVGEALGRGRAAGAATGVEAEVIDPRTLVPLDIEHDRRVGPAHRARGRRARGGHAPAASAPSSPPQLQARRSTTSRRRSSASARRSRRCRVSPPLEDAYRPGADEIYAAARRRARVGRATTPTPLRPRRGSRSP